MSRLETISYPFLEQLIYRRIMNDGMTVYYIPKEGFQEISAILTVDFGSVDTSFTENDSLKSFPAGIAHFLEHQVFELEKQDASQIFSQYGAESNAFTSFNRTSYFFSTTQELEKSLDLLLNFTKNLHITSSSVDKERGIIEQEIAMYQDDADFRLYSGALANLYPNTPLADDIAGTTDSVQHISKENLIDNFETFYRPDFKTLILVGDFSVKLIDRIVRKHERMRRKTLSEIIKSPVPLTPVIPKSSIQLEVASPKLALGFRSSVTSQFSILEQRIGLRLFLAMLFGWTSNRYQEWYDKGKIDDSFDIEIEVSKAYRFFIVMLDTDSPIAMGAQIRKTLNAIRQNPDVSVTHLNLIKNEMYGEFIRSLDNIDELGHQFLQFLDRDMTYFDFPELLHQLHFEKVIAIGEEFFQQADRTEFVIFPK